MNLESVILRALEPKDLNDLISIENNQYLWKYSNRNEPFSKHLLSKYIEQQNQDIFEVKQKRFVISQVDENFLGFVDLFDFTPIHRRAGVGIVLRKDQMGKGIGKKSLELLNEYAYKHLNINILFANIAFENRVSILLFESCGYEQQGLKKNWNFYDGTFHDEYIYVKSFS